MVSHDLDECISKSYKCFHTGTSEGIGKELLKTCLKSSIKLTQDNTQMLALLKEMMRKLANFQENHKVLTDNRWLIFFRDGSNYLDE